ncbi:MAG: LacI family DNA-binding transcriptional regulator [Actinomycetota bacterium]
MDKKVDIYFIARKAKVSPATVSRVFNRAEIVSEQKKKKVLEVCRRYNYQPSHVARSMRTKRTHYIGFVIPNMVNPFFFELLQGADDYAGERDYYLVLFNSENDYRKEMKFLDQFLARNIDGIIISGIAGGRKDNLFAREVLRKNIPCVLVDRYIEGLDIPSVVTDNFKGGMLAARHLIGLGHRDIGIISFGLKVRIIKDRYLGFKEVLEKNGIEEKFLVEIPVGATDIRRELAEERKLLLSGKVSAFFCISDLIAINLMEFLKENGKEIPSQASVIGFDNITSAALVEPKLTTIAQKIYRMGMASSQLLIDVIENSEGSREKRRILDPRLVIRGSCAKI